MSSLSSHTTCRSKRIGREPCCELDALKDFDELEEWPEGPYQLSLILDEPFPADDAGVSDSLGLNINGEPLHDRRADLRTVGDCRWQDASSDLQLQLQSCSKLATTHSAAAEIPRESRLDSVVSLSTSGSSVPSSLDDRLTCRICQTTFANGYLLEDHAKEEEHYTYLCSVQGCNKSYRRRDVLTRHVATHTYSETISCPYCPNSNRKRIFQRRDNLSQHVRTRHPQDYKIWKSRRPPTPRRRSSPLISTVTRAVGCDNLEQTSESIGALPGRLPPDHSTSDAPMTDQYHSIITTNDVASALGRALGDENNIVVQVIQRRVDLIDQSATEELARSLAQLALKEPGKIPKSARVQLQQTCAERVLGGELQFESTGTALAQS